MANQRWHPDWLVPQWPVPDHVHAVFTTRHGGVSLPPFDSMNLGRPSDDDAQAVDANRARLRQALGVEPNYLSQVHGTRSVELRGPVVAGSVQADACATTLPGVVCTIRVADCLPVLLAHAHAPVVAGAHAGWRGLAEGVLEANVAQFQALASRHTGPNPAAAMGRDTLAWLGPCIGPDAFEVGDEVRSAFVSHDPAAAALFRPGKPGKWFADLPGLARLRLLALGVSRIFGNDSSPSWCTAGNPSRFFSHRRDHIALGGSGRMAACIWFD
ncbi:MAG: peptidoglycan editing factor PgeF [Burkholderiaceae bacterium]